jgi:hypothetical protein
MDAVDNMDMNEYNGRVLKVNLAKSTKIVSQGRGDRASTSMLPPPSRRPTDAHQFGSQKSGSSSMRNHWMRVEVRGCEP